MSVIASRPRAGLIVAVLVGAALAGCTQPPPPPGGSPVGDYFVTGYVDRDGAFVGLIPGTRITLSVKADGRVAGNACNNYFADWRAQGHRISFTGAGSTDMACVDPPGVMAQESGYLANFGNITMWQREGQKLTLASGGRPDERGRPLITAEVLFRPAG
jgi:hypothetical protein